MANEPTPSNIDNLKLGITTSELITATKQHIDNLYDANTAQGIAIKSAEETAKNALLLAQQKNKVKSYTSLDEMYRAFEAAGDNDFNVGDEILIADTAFSHDFWVSDKQETPFIENTPQSTFALPSFETGNIGYFTLSRLENNIEVANMVVANSNFTKANEIIIANSASSKEVVGSGYTITDKFPISENNTIPTAYTVASRIASINTTVNQNMSTISQHSTQITLNTQAISDNSSLIAKTNSDVSSLQTKATTQENKITSIEERFDEFATKEELKNAGKVQSISINKVPQEIDDNGNVNLELGDIGGGKVKDVQLNSLSILNEETGIANIVLDDLKSDYIEVAPQKNAITVKNITYDAIVVENNEDVTLELFNRNGEEVITQIINKNNQLYYCLPQDDENTYYLRKANGNTTNNNNSVLESLLGIKTVDVKFLNNNLQGQTGDYNSETKNTTIRKIIHFDKLFAMINGVKLLDNSEEWTLIYAENVTNKNIVTKHPNTSITNEVIFKIYATNDNGATIGIQEVIIKSVSSPSVSYNVSFPLKTFKGIEHNELLKIEKLNQATYYNHNLHFHFTPIIQLQDGFNSEVLANVYINYVDNDPTETTDIKELINCNFFQTILEKKKEYVFASSGSLVISPFTTGQTGGILTTPYGILHSVKITNTGIPYLTIEGGFFDLEIVERVDIGNGIKSLALRPNKLEKSFLLSSPEGLKISRHTTVPVSLID